MLRTLFSKIRQFGWYPCMSALLACGVASHAAEVTLDLSTRHQTIDGWGTSMSASNNQANLPYSDIRWRNAYRDAGMNILRIRLNKDVLVTSSNDYATPIVLGSNINTNIDLMNFRTASVQAMGNMASWLTQNALEPERVKIVGSAWSPPHWMKGPTGAEQSWVGDNRVPPVKHPTPWLSNTDNPFRPNNPSPSGDSIGGRLKTEDPQTLQQYGRYMAAWVKGFESEYDVELDTITLQNESTFENPFDSMAVHFGPPSASGAKVVDYTQYAKLLKAVRDAWNTYGISTKVQGPHVARVGPTPQNPHNLNDQMRLIQAVKDDSDPTLIDFLSGYAANYYMDATQDAVKATAGYYHGKNAVAANWASYLFAPGISQDDKPIWYWETGAEVGNWLNGSGGMTPGSNGAINVALKIHNALVYSDAAAYIYWQMSDGGDNVNNGTLLGKSQLDNPSASKKYDAFKQFSRYIRPGAQRIEALFENGKSAIGGANEYDAPNSLNVSAFLHDEDQTLTLVLINMKSSPSPVTLSVPQGLGISSFDVYRTSSTDNFASLADVPVTNGQVSFSAPGYSVITLVGAVTPILTGDYNDNGIVDAADYVVWRDNLNSPNSLPNDPTPGVTMEDYEAWRDHFGNVAGGSQGTTPAVVPEPNHLVLLMIGAALMPWRTHTAFVCEGLRLSFHVQ